jgi:hypothetical protein
MRWLPTTLPPSAAALLARCMAGRGRTGAEYSRAQVTVAALHAFASLPDMVRLQVGREYAAHLGAQLDTIAAGPPVPQPADGQGRKRVRS